MEIKCKNLEDYTDSELKEYIKLSEQEIYEWRKFKNIVKREYFKRLKSK